MLNGHVDQFFRKLKNNMALNNSQSDCLKSLLY